MADPAAVDEKKSKKNQGSFKARTQTKRSKKVAI